MPIPAPERTFSFLTEDPVVTFTFTLGVDPLGPSKTPLVTAEIDLPWEVSSPHDPVTAELRLKRPALLNHISDDRETLSGQLSLQRLSDGRLAVNADVFYGEGGRHHLIGVLGIFPSTDG